MTSILILAAVAATPVPGTATSFTDWTIGCDNGRACRATSFMDENMEGNPVILSIVRDGAAGAVPKLQVFAQEIGGPRMALYDSAGTKIADLPERQGYYETPMTAMIWGSIRNLDKVELRDAKGKSFGTASLKGATAAIRAMDDRQKRVGTVTALVATGSKPASAVPAPPPLPIVTYRAPPATAPLQPTAAEIARMRKVTDCTSDEGEMATAESFRVDAATTMVLLSCGHGAYNMSSVPLILTGSGKTRAIRIAPFDYSGGVSDSKTAPYALLTNAGWDDASARLQSYAKGRGIGDCGTAESWVWDGRKLRLIEYTAMDECRGAFDGWPTLWRADAKRVK